MKNPNSDIENKPGYYGCAHELEAHDEKRQSQLREQRDSFGFDDTETYSLDTTIVQFVLPRLKRFREVHCSYPANITEQEWKEILDKMILGFEERSQVGGVLKEDKETPHWPEAKRLFVEYFDHLWW